MELCRIPRGLRRRLRALGVENFLKATGGKGVAETPMTDLPRKAVRERGETGRWTPPQMQTAGRRAGPPERRRHPRRLPRAARRREGRESKC